MQSLFKPEYQTARPGGASSIVPPAPRTPEECGLPFLFLVELLVKVLFVRGQTGLPELAYVVRLAPSVVDTVTAFMRAEKLCEAVRRGRSNTDADLVYTLTDNGRARGAEYMGRSAYAGPAPVSLSDYSARVTMQKVAQMGVVRNDVVAAFASLVISPAVTEQLGAAMNSGRAIFIHGPSGSGKTYLAERLADLLTGDILVPHAVLVDGEVIQVNDPAIHKPSSAPDMAAQSDTRWVRCKRPAVLTGGELTLEALDLRFDAASRYYQAPPHLKANNGVFIIDDLGRQRCSPAELMNRWIVPLDRKMDFLSLHTGHKFVVPFDVMVVFSSNFTPQTLADDAFLRRLGYKIHVGEQSQQSYARIFRNECERQGVPWSADAFHYLLHEKHGKLAQPLLACYPRDLIAQVCDLARYECLDPVLSERALDWAWNNYFVGG